MSNDWQLLRWKQNIENIEILEDQIGQNTKQKEKNEKVINCFCVKWVTRKIWTNNDHAAVYIDEKRGNKILLGFSFQLWRIINTIKTRTLEKRWIYFN